MPLQDSCLVDKCIGLEGSCKDKTSNFVKAAAYVGMDAKNPSNNYAIGMITDITFGKVFDILGDKWSKFKEWKRELPSNLAETGLKVFDPNMCTERNTDNKTVAKQGSIDLNCYAYFSYSPMQAQALSFKSGTINIAQGLAMSGRINIMGYEVGVEAAISTTRFYINVDMDPINLGEGTIRIGASLDSTNEATGNPKFLVDFSPTSVRVDISGHFRFLF